VWDDWPHLSGEIPPATSKTALTRATYLALAVPMRSAFLPSAQMLQRGWMTALGFFIPPRLGATFGESESRKPAPLAARYMAHISRSGPDRPPLTGSRSCQRRSSGRAPNSQVEHVRPVSLDQRALQRALAIIARDTRHFVHANRTTAAVPDCADGGQDRSQPLVPSFETPLPTRNVPDIFCSPCLAFRQAP
jgi:hypothetical protein